MPSRKSHCPRIHTATQFSCYRDDTDSLHWSAESDVGRTCLEAGVERVHEELLVVDEVPPVRPSAVVTREGFAQLDAWDLVELFKQRGCLLRSVPRFLWEHSGSVSRLLWKRSWQERQGGTCSNKSGGGSCSCFLPKMMLHQPPFFGLLGKDKLVARFDKFVAGH